MRTAESGNLSDVIKAAKVADEPGWILASNGVCYEFEEWRDEISIWVRAREDRIAELEAALEAAEEALRDVKRTWTFDGGQFHTHNWHDREDCYARHRKAFRAALSPSQEEPRE